MQQLMAGVCMIIYVEYLSIGAPLDKLTVAKGLYYIIIRTISDRRRPLQQLLFLPPTEMQSTWLLVAIGKKNRNTRGEVTLTSRNQSDLIGEPVNC